MPFPNHSVLGSLATFRFKLRQIRSIKLWLIRSEALSVEFRSLQETKIRTFGNRKLAAKKKSSHVCWLALMSLCAPGRSRVGKVTRNIFHSTRLDFSGLAEKRVAQKLRAEGFSDHPRGMHFLPPPLLGWMSLPSRRKRRLKLARVVFKLGFFFGELQLQQHCFGDDFRGEEDLSWFEKTLKKKVH